MKKIYIFLILFSFTTVSFSKQLKQEVVSIGIAVPNMKKIPIYYETNVYFKADISINLKSEISGRVIDISVKEGEKVKKGQIIAKIDSKKYDYQYSSQLYTIKKLEEIYSYNLSVLKRKEFLYKKGLISEEEYQLAKKNLKTSYNDLLAAKERLKDLERQKKETVIKAPFDGIIDKKFINVGDYITPSTNLFYILNPDSIKAIFYLPQRFLKKVKLDDIISIHIDEIGSLQGKIEYISYSLTPESLIEIKASTQKNRYLREGLYGKVKILDKIVNGFLLPEKTVFFEGQESFILKVENGKTKKVYVKVIGQKPGFFIVKADLKPKDKIVLYAPFGIKENMPVKTEDKL